MRALVKERPGPGLVLADVPKPRPGPNEVLIRVKRAAFCGTDIHIHTWDPWAKGRVKPPLVLGHEFAGEVAELGSHVAGLQAGDPVTAESHIVCGVCRLCRTGNGHTCRETRIIGVDVPGAFADFIVMPASNVWKLDPGISLEVGAIHDPMGNAFHTALHGTVIAGQTVLVIGAGPIGLMSIGIARAAGAARVIATEISGPRRALALKMGAAEALDPKTDDVAGAVHRLTEGLGADVVLEMSGHPDGVRQALKLVRSGGRVQLLGLPREPVSLDLANDVIFKGITVHGVIGRRMFETWFQVRSFLRNRLFDPGPVITHRMALEDYEKAMDLAIRGEAGKIIFQISKDD